MNRKLYECGICECYHPWDFNGDCRDDKNRITDVDASDEVLSWEERTKADYTREEERHE